MKSSSGGAPDGSVHLTSVELLKGSNRKRRRADGSRSRLSTGPGPNEPAAWPPDGKDIAIGSSRDGNTEVYIEATNGSSERRLTTAPGNQWAQLWTDRGLIVTSSLPDAEISDWFLVDPASGAAGSVPWLKGVPTPLGYGSAGRPRVGRWPRPIGLG